MSYYVRILTPSDKVMAFAGITVQGKSIKLVSGEDTAWERIEICEPVDDVICILERHPVYTGSAGETELNKLKESIQKANPDSAREWLRHYVSNVKAIYSFQITPDNITKAGWQVLGRIQNLLKDLLGGIIQADNEGFYNESGDLILWQMYSEAGGTITAATLDEKGNWISYSLKLSDTMAVEQFKQGIVPKKGLLGRILKR